MPPERYRPLVRRLNWHSDTVVDCTRADIDVDPYSYGPGLVGVGNMTLKLSTVDDAVALIEAVLAATRRLIVANAGRTPLFPQDAA